MTLFALPFVSRFVLRPVVFLGLALVALGASLSGCAGLVDRNGGKVSYSSYAAGVADYLKGTTAEMADDPLAASEAYISSLMEDPDNIPLRLRSLNLALLGNDVPTAIRLAKSIPEEARQQTMTQLLLVMASVKEGKLDDAIKRMSKMAEQNSDVLQFQALLQHMKVADGWPVDKAVEQLEDMTLPPALEGRRYYQIGRIWLESGHIKEAMAALEKANGYEPGAVFTTLLLGNVYERNGMPDKAEQLYKSFRSINGTTGLLVGFDARVAKGGMPSAFTSDLHNDLSTTMMDFALLMWAQGVSGPARQLVNVSMWLNDNSDPWLLYYAGIVEDVGGDADLALARYVKAGKQDGLGLAAGLRRVSLLQQNDKLALSQKELKALGRKYPNEMAVWNVRAEQAFAAKDYTAALAAYQKIAELLPSTAPDSVWLQLLYATGVAYERLGNLPEAEKYLRKALAIDPANPQVLNYLGYSWVDKGINLAEAFDMLQKAHMLAPDDGAIVDSLGWAYYKRDNYKEARVYLERAVELEPDDVEVTNHLGDVYAKLGDMDAAREQWRRALALIEQEKGSSSGDLSVESAELKKILLGKLLGN